MKRLTVYLLAFMLLLTAIPPFTASATDDAPLPGDANGDGLITPMDITTLRRYIVGGYGVELALPSPGTAMEENETTIAFRPEEFIPADANGDGEIALSDITTLRQYLVGGFGAQLVPSPVFRKTSVDLARDTTLYKTYGRAYLTDGGVSLLWPDDAVEFTAKCEGDIDLLCTAGEAVYLRVYADGTELGRPAATATQGGLRSLPVFRAASIRSASCATRISRRRTRSSACVRSTLQASGPP